MNINTFMYFICICMNKCISFQVVGTYCTEYVVRIPTYTIYPFVCQVLVKITHNKNHRANANANANIDLIN